MPPVVDVHAHAFPNPLRSELLGKLSLPGMINEVRSQARRWWSPVAGSMHHAQTFLRHLPDSIRRPLDEIGGVAPVLGLLLESTASDLVQSMEESGVTHAVVIAHPPLISNEFVMELASRKKQFLAAVNIPPGTLKPVAALRSFVKNGAVALKIHPAADGEGADSTHYRKLLKAAAGLGIPVILHTGALHTRIFYKDPEQSRAERFIPWFKEFPETRFILAHMNFHEPHIAFDLAEEYLNLYLDTSWQPAEVIGESVRRLGAERILFGTDWPFIGGNFEVGLRRIHECVAAGTLKEDESRLILGENAAKLLRIASDVTSSA